MTDSDYILRLMSAERAASPPRGAAQAGLQRLLATMATQAAPLPVAVGSLKLGWALIAKWVGVGFVIGTAGAGVGSYASRAVTSSAVPRPSSAFSPPRQAHDSALGVGPALSASTAAPALPPSVSKPGPAGAVVAGSAVPSEAPTFDEELRLITAAKHELDAGRAALARRWLDEHRQRFPRGVFSLERDGLSVLADCNLSRNPALARQFASQHPDSPMLEQLLRRCGVDSPDGARMPTSSDFASGTNGMTPPKAPIKD